MPAAIEQMSAAASVSFLISNGVKVIFQLATFLARLWLWHLTVLDEAAGGCEPHKRRGQQKVRGERHEKRRLALRFDHKHAGIEKLGVGE